jgi:hypothetical protein
VIHRYLNLTSRVTASDSSIGKVKNLPSQQSAWRKEIMSLIAFLNAFLKILANPALVSGLATLLSKMLHALGH